MAGHAPGPGPEGVLPSRKLFPAAAVEVEARRRTDRTVTPRPLASACKGPPFQEARRDAAPEPEIPTSAAGAAAVGRKPGTAAGKAVEAAGRREPGTAAAGKAAEAAGGRESGTAVAGEEAEVGDRTETGAAGEAEAGRRGSGARSSRGRGRRRRGSTMDGSCGAEASVLRDLGFWRDGRDEAKGWSFQKVREAFGPKGKCGAKLKRREAEEDGQARLRCAWW